MQRNERNPALNPALILGVSGSDQLLVNTALLMTKISLASHPSLIPAGSET
jgi:hypothetical protein